MDTLQKQTVTTVICHTWPKQLLLKDRKTGPCNKLATPFPTDDNTTDKKMRDNILLIYYITN